MGLIKCPFDRGDGVHLISIFKLLICIEIVFLSLARSTASASTNSRTCYYPDKSISKGTPCDPNAAVSPCCGPGFICLSNGLCSPGPEDRKSYQYDLYRSACTDPTWNSTACPRLCFGDGDTLDGGQGIVSCKASGSYCCTQRTDCCSQSQNVFQLQTGSRVTTIPYTTNSPTKTSGVPTVTPVPTGSSTPHGRHSRHRESHVSKGAKIGIGVAAAIVGLVIIAALIAWFVSRQRTSRHQQNERPTTPDLYDEKEVRPELLYEHKPLPEMPAMEHSRELPPKEPGVHVELSTDSNVSRAEESLSTRTPSTGWQGSLNQPVEMEAYDSHRR